MPRPKHSSRTGSQRKLGTSTRCSVTKSAHQAGTVAASPKRIYGGATCLLFHGWMKLSNRLRIPGSLYIDGRPCGMGGTCLIRTGSRVIPLYHAFHASTLLYTKDRQTRCLTLGTVTAICVLDLVSLASLAEERLQDPYLGTMASACSLCVAHG